MVKYRHDLPKLLKSLGLPLVGSELGVAEGNFSRDLLSEGMEKLYSVDAWATLEGRGDGANSQEWHDENFRKTMEKLIPFGDKSVILRGLTSEMANKVPDSSLGLLYLDAAHWYEDVIRDLQVWAPKVVDGGIIAGHDYLAFQYGVNSAVKDFFSGKIYTIEENKPEDAGFLFVWQK